MVIVAMSVSGNEVIPRCIGNFVVDTNLKDVSLPEFLRMHKKHVNDAAKPIRVLALIDARFNAVDLAAYGWQECNRMGDIAVLMGNPATADYLVSIPGIRTIKKPSRIYPCMDSARVQCSINEVVTYSDKTGLPKAFSGKGVLLGMMDTEFDTQIPAFLDSLGKTRFVAVWDQNDTTKGFPNKYGYGVIKRGAELTANPWFGTTGSVHGTMMTSYAAGSEPTVPYGGVAPKVTIAGMQYTQDDNDLITGMQWLFALADSLKMPCVVNMSIGSASGPHDGTSLIDKAIDTLAQAGHIVVGAMGNDGAGKIHVSFPVSRTDSVGSWFVSEVSVTNGITKGYSAVDLWGEAEKSFSATWYIVNAQTKQYQKARNAISTQIAGQYKPQTIVFGTDSVVLEIAAERTSILNRKPHMQAALTTHKADIYLGCIIVGLSTTTTTVNGWNVMKKPCISLDIAGFKNGDSISSVAEIGGTGKKTISVSSYTSKSNYTLWNGTPGGNASPYHGLVGFGGYGPTLDGRIKPDIVAPGAWVTGALGRKYTDQTYIVMWNNYPDILSRYAVNGGTSISAPIVSGAVALMLEAKPDLTPDQVRTILIQTAHTDEFTGTISTPNNAWGGGKLNVLGALQKLVGQPVYADKGIERVNIVKGVFLQKLSANTFRIVGSEMVLKNAHVDMYSADGRMLKQYQRLGAKALLVCDKKGVVFIRVQSGAFREVFKRELL